MNGQVFQLVYLALNAAAIGLEREAVLSKVLELEMNGASPEDIRKALVAMRNEKLAAAGRAAA